MRILHISEKINELAGGTSVLIGKLAAAAADEDRGPVEVISFDLKELGPVIETPPNVELHLFKPRRPYLYGLSHEYSGYLKRAAEDADSVFHVHNMWRAPMVSACRLAYRHKRPCIVSPHGALNPWALSVKRYRKELMWWLVEKWRLECSTVLNATSQQEAEHLAALLPGSPIAVVPPGTEVPELADRKPAGETRTALFLSRIVPNKGLLLLLKAWSIIRPKNWRLVVAGSDEVGHVAVCKKAVRQYGLEDSITFIGPVFQEKRWKPYLEADLYILPTLSENFGITIAEALASGVPVITTQGAPWPELISKNCGWWIEISVDFLVKAMREAFEMDAAELREMGLRGRALIEGKYTWPSIARQMMQVYDWASGKAEKPEFIIQR